MIGKFFSRVIKELTPADTTPVTLNATGNYNPRYGKQKIYVSGKGGSGTSTPGNPYDNSYTNAGNYTPGNPYDNSYTNLPVVVAPLLGVKVGTNYYVYGTYWVNYTTLSPTSSGQYYNGRQDIASGSNLYNNYAATPYSSPFIPSTYTVMGFVPPSYTVIPFSPTWADVYGNVPGSTTPGNYVAGNSGVYAGTYTPGNYVAGYSGTYAATVTTGSSTNVFGVSLPGGYGSAAPVVPSTAGTSVPTYSTTPISITVPAGGYVTITFTL
jgi:hypothetical protein